MASQRGLDPTEHPTNHLLLPSRGYRALLPAGLLLLCATLSLAQGTPSPSAPPTSPVPAQATPPSAAPGTSTPTTSTSDDTTPGTTTPGSSAAPTTTDPATAAPGAAHPAPPALAAADSARYVIGAEDVLQVTVWNEQKMSGAVPVRPDGMISIALIGDLPAAGKTPMQLGTDIADQAKKYIQDPNVTVIVTAVNSQRVFMVGEVGKVGPVALTPGMTPLQAISAAGGPGPFANLKRIYILRGTGAHQQKIPFNYKQALKGDNRGDLELHPGDTVVIP